MSSKRVATRWRSRAGLSWQRALYPSTVLRRYSTRSCGVLAGGGGCCWRSRQKIPSLVRLGAARRSRYARLAGTAHPSSRRSRSALQMSSRTETEALERGQDGFRADSVWEYDTETVNLQNHRGQPGAISTNRL